MVLRRTQYKGNRSIERFHVASMESQIKKGLTERIQKLKPTDIIELWSLSNVHEQKFKNNRIIGMLTDASIGCNHSLSSPS